MFRRIFTLAILLNFIFSSILPSAVYAQFLSLPQPGAMVSASAPYAPLVLKGLQVNPQNPMLFDFIVDTGDSGFRAGVDDTLIREGSQELIKYFLASLTIPEKEQWVNLSPHEQDRIMPEGLDRTAMGRDMLAEDYLLKQVTASFMHPDKDLGKTFWGKVYAQAQQQFNTTDIPVDTFNKVWVSADRADVYVHDNTAFVVGAHLKVMLESDYLAQSAVGADFMSAHMRADTSLAPFRESTPTRELAKQVLKEVIIPALEKEVNEGKNFARLRQIFHSMILATWYKKNLREALLTQAYADKSKTNGVQIARGEMDPQAIYSQYVEAYKKGVVNLVKEEANAETGEVELRKYFSGGLADMAQAQVVEFLPGNFSMNHALRVTARLDQVLHSEDSRVKGHDAAMQDFDIASRAMESFSLPEYRSTAEGQPDETVALLVPDFEEGLPAYLWRGNFQQLMGERKIFSVRIEHNRRAVLRAAQEVMWTNEPFLVFKWKTGLILIRHNGQVLHIEVDKKSVFVRSEGQVITPRTNENHAKVPQIGAFLDAAARLSADPAMAVAVLSEEERGWLEQFIRDDGFKEGPLGWQFSLFADRPESLGLPEVFSGTGPIRQRLSGSESRVFSVSDNGAEISSGQALGRVQWNSRLYVFKGGAAVVLLEQAPDQAMAVLSNVAQRRAVYDRILANLRAERLVEGVAVERDAEVPAMILWRSEEAIGPANVSYNLAYRTISALAREFGLEVRFSPAQGERKENRIALYSADSARPVNFREMAVVLAFNLEKTRRADFYQGEHLIPPGGSVMIEFKPGEEKHLSIYSAAGEHQVGFALSYSTDGTFYSGSFVTKIEVNEEDVHGGPDQSYYVGSRYSGSGRIVFDNRGQEEVSVNERDRGTDIPEVVLEPGESVAVAIPDPGSKHFEVQRADKNSVPTTFRYSASGGKIYLGAMLRDEAPLGQARKISLSDSVVITETLATGPQGPMIVFHNSSPVPVRIKADASMGSLEPLNEQESAWIVAAIRGGAFSGGPIDVTSSSFNSLPSSLRVSTDVRFSSGRLWVGRLLDDLEAQVFSVRDGGKLISAQEALGRTTDRTWIYILGNGRAYVLLEDGPEAPLDQPVEVDTDAAMNVATRLVRLGLPRRGEAGTSSGSARLWRATLFGLKDTDGSLPVKVVVPGSLEVVLRVSGEEVITFRDQDATATAPKMYPQLARLLAARAGNEAYMHVLYEGNQYAVFSDGAIYALSDLAGRQDVLTIIKDQDPKTAYPELRIIPLVEHFLNGTSPSDAAMPPGGIDMNAEKMRMDEKGEKINMVFDPAQIEKFQRGDFTGLEPVILNIAPITNIRPLLGLGGDDVTAPLAAVSFDRKAVLREEELEA
jgi:hypothetical protein